MQSQKPEHANPDEAVNPENAATPEVSAVEATVSPAEDQDPLHVAPEQSHNDSAPSSESNSMNRPAEPMPSANMFQRPSARSAAEDVSSVPQAVRSSSGDVAGSRPSQTRPLISPTAEPVPTQQVLEERQSSLPNTLGRHFEAAARPSAHEPPSERFDLPTVVAGPVKLKSLLDLAPTEHLVREVASGDDGRFVLTNMRLIYQGGSSEGTLFAAAAVADITAIEFGRRLRDSRSAWWGIIGMIAAIAVWQVTPTESVGAIAGAVVAGISALLLADYWFRPPGLVLRFGTAGGAIEGAVPGKRVQEAEELAAEVQRLRCPRSGVSAAGSGTPSGSRPPSGSPGLH
jgi:hypothetical protein